MNAMLVLTVVAVICVGLGSSAPNNGTGHIRPPPNYPNAPNNGQQNGKLTIHRVFAPNNSPFQSGISSGLCYTEVPTATLISPSRPGYVPQSNGTQPGYSKIQICCDGYKPKPNRFRVCEPICDSECIHANCTAVNTCTCYPGYILDTLGHCTPKCPIGCANGYCKTPTSTECICKPGYKLDEHGEQCIPECAHGCGNGRCIAPNQCECNPGYKQNEAGGCTHFCNGGCGMNQECIGPNTCECRIGYTRNERGECGPHCEKPCLPGMVCTSPNKCTCLDKNGVNCQGSCSRSCLNGRCIGREVCQCNPGYRNDPTAWYKCIADCPGGCINGVCSAPNFCICNPGYIKTSSVYGNVCQAKV